MVDAFSRHVLERPAASAMPQPASAMAMAMATAEPLTLYVDDVE